MLQIRLDEEAVLKTVGQKWLWGSSPYCSAEERIILQYSKDMEYLKEWTYDEILDNNFNLKAIQSNCSGHAKTSQGYIWKYRSEESVV